MRRVVAAALLAGVLAANTPSQAALFYCPDLLGLVIRSKVIVLVGTTSGAGSDDMAIVKKAYLGALLPGERIERGISGYMLRKSVDEADPPGLQAAILFFTDEKAKEMPAVNAIKPVLEDGVYGFEQFSNPGPLELVPETLGESIFSNSRVTLARYEAELRKTICRVVAYRRAAAVKDPAQRTRRLMALLGPAQPPPAVLADYTRRRLDELEDMIVNDIHSAGGMKAALVALSHLRSFGLPTEREGAGAWTKEAVLTFAEDTAQEARLRATAVLALGDFRFRYQTLDDLFGFLGDPSPEVRRAAAAALSRSGKRYAVVNLKRALEAESEEAVRAIFIEALERMQHSP